jgi:hypothetical protein
VAQSRGKRARPIDTTKAKTKLEFKDPNQVFAAEFPDHKHTKSMADVWPKEQKTEQEWTVCNPVSSSKSSFSPSFSGSPSGYQSVSASSATVIVEEAATMPDASQAPSKPQLEQAVNLLKLVT